MEINLTDIILAVIALLSAIITGVIIPLVKSKLSMEQKKQVDYWLKIFIAAAETAYKQDGMGEVKKQEVIENITAWAEKNNIELDMQEISESIEALVRSLTAEGVIN